MKTFDLYRHPTVGYEAVKRGFSWPGFFIGAIWALSKRMWLGGTLLLIAWVILFGVRGEEPDAAVAAFVRKAAGDPIVPTPG